MHAELEKLVGKRRISPDQVNRYKALLSGTTEHADYADCDFVIEAVFEEMSVKKEVFASLEKHISTECVLATNTSSLSVSEMAADLAASRAGDRLPLLQPGCCAAAARGDQGHRHR